MDDEQKDAPKVIMLPPTMVLQFIVAGIVLDWIFPFSIGHAWGWLGLVLLAAAYGLVAWSKKLFEKAGTNVPPNKPATAIVTDGPYKFTRNPMYLSFILAYVGLALLADAPFMLLLTFGLFYMLDQKVIAPEEEYLTEKFGDEYTAYRVSVRRWL